MIWFPIASQDMAIVTGLASGEHEPTGWRVMLVVLHYSQFLF